MAYRPGPFPAGADTAAPVDNMRAVWDELDELSRALAAQPDRGDLTDLHPRYGLHTLALNDPWFNVDAGRAARYTITPNGLLLVEGLIQVPAGTPVVGNNVWWNMPPDVAPAIDNFLVFTTFASTGVAVGARAEHTINPPPTLTASVGYRVLDAGTAPETWNNQLVYLSGITYQIPRESWGLGE